MRVTSKGQVTIPKPIRDQLGIKVGSEVEFVEEAGVVRLVAGTDVSDAERKARRERIDGWLKKLQGMSGIVDTGGMTGVEYVQWIRDERDDLHPR